MPFEITKQSKIFAVCVLTWSGWKMTKWEGEKNRKVELGEEYVERHREAKEHRDKSNQGTDFFHQKQLPSCSYNFPFYRVREKKN